MEEFRGVGIPEEGKEVSRYIHVVNRLLARTSASRLTGNDEKLEISKSRALFASSHPLASRRYPTTPRQRT